MKVGLIARGEDRGLGLLTHAFYEHVNPDRTLLVTMGVLARGFPCHPERYPDATTVAFDGHQLPEAEVRAWLHGLDVLYSAETFYDWRVCTWAAEARVATVLHVMPEFYRHHADAELPGPSTWWAPTTWRLDRLPAGTRLVRVPVPAVPDGVGPGPDDGPLRVVHVAGHRAAQDRNGTGVFLQAARYVRQPADLTVRCQDPRLPSRTGHGRNVTVRLQLGGTPDRWDLYRGQQVLVLPRRYGGLCLPAQEAMGCGLAVAMPDVPPNLDLPVVALPSRWHGTLATQAGAVPLAEVPASAVAHTIDRLAADRGLLAAHQAAARTWAHANSWAALLPVYRAELARAVLQARGTGA